MIQSVQKYCSQKLLKLRARANAQSEMIDMASQLTHIKEGLILLPADERLLPPAVEKLTDFTTLFKETNFQYIVLSSMPFDFPPQIKENSRFIAKKDLTLIGSPSKAFLEEFSNKRYDILIDLNIEFDAFATYLASKSSARLRVCLSDPHREPFYNFQVSTFGANEIASKYNVLLKYLSEATSPSKKLDAFATM